MARALLLLPLLAGCFPEVELSPPGEVGLGEGSAGDGTSGDGDDGSGGDGSSSGSGDGSDEGGSNEGNDDDDEPCTVYVDADGDGYGTGEPSEVDCDEIPSGWVGDDTDCDDGDDAVFPGATEICNGIDDDCDGALDDDDDSLDLSTANTLYIDEDGDGYGTDTVAAVTCDETGVGAVDNAEDCDDRDAEVNPDATEVCNEVDDDCDDLVDDADDDLDTSTRSTWYADGDGDGFGDADVSEEACAQPSAGVADATDCDDGDTFINPDATEVCNEVDDDCDGDIDDDDSSLDTSTQSTFYDDTDGDGYGDPDADTEACSAPSGTVSNDDDCDDDDGDVNPAETEVCNELDDDCDGDIDDDDSDLDTSTQTTWYEDADLDGYGNPDVSTDACDEPSGYVEDADDCDDDDEDVNPAATEDCNGIDDDCDGTADSSSVCPCYVDHYGDHVYLFCDSAQTWEDADDACTDETNFELVVVDDSSENQWVTSTMTGYSSSDWWWMGFHDRNASSGQEPDAGWEWVDGSIVSYTNWNNNQPDDWRSDEDCGHLYETGYWNDLDCDRTSWGSRDLYYICEATVSY